MSLQVHLEKFEGPLGLLLHLIRSQEMNIFDIDIAKITQQYLDYIRVMRSLDLELAGEFVAMAASLLQIKSRMLLPQYNEQGEESEPEDPRRELVQKLLEYQKFQEASRSLGARDWMWRDVWPRGERTEVKSQEEDSVIVEENPLFSLIAAYRKVIRSMKAGVHKVVGALESIASRMEAMKEKLIVGQRVSLDGLITAEGILRSNQVLVTFLTLLELAKMGFVSLFQSEPFSVLHIETKRAIDRSVVDHVENYEGQNAEVVAEKILIQAASGDMDQTTSTHHDEDGPHLISATDEDIEAEEQRWEESKDGESLKS